MIELVIRMMRVGIIGLINVFATYRLESIKELYVMETGRMVW